MAGRKKLGVYSHGNGAWRIQIKDPKTGKWKQIVATRKRFLALNVPFKNSDQITKSEAYCLKQKYEEILHQEQTYNPPEHRVTLNEAIKEYLKYQRNTPDFLKDKKRVLGEFLDITENQPLTDVNKTHIRSFEEYLRMERAGGPCKGRQMHPSSVARYLRYVRSFFNFCYREGWIFRSPFLNYPLPRDKSTPIKVYTLTELKKIVDWLRENVSNQEREYVIWIITGFIGLGLRSIELQGLDWKKFDPKERFIHISESKNPESCRSQPVPLCLMELFKSKMNKSGPMFLTRSGNRTSKSQMQSLRKRITKHYPGFTWQRLRRTYATLLQAAGIDSMIIDRLLGHSLRSSPLRISAMHYIGKEYKFYRSLVDQALKPLEKIFYI